MAYNGPRRGSGKKYTSVRLTGLFKTKKRGLCVGTINDEAIDKLIEKIKEAKKQKKELTVFLWAFSPQEGKPVPEHPPLFTISVDLAQPPPSRGAAIEPDPFDRGDTPDDEVPF